jgi:hypothetical protein
LAEVADLARDRVAGRSASSNSSFRVRLRGIAIMPISMSAAVLSSQLMVTVADRVPNFNVRPSCRESTVPDCVSQEQIARDALVKEWPRFNAQEKARCAEEARHAGPPSYVEWLTCLHINANARTLSTSAASSAAPTTAGGAGTPEAGGGTSSATHASRRHARRRHVSQR